MRLAIAFILIGGLAHGQADPKKAEEKPVDAVEAYDSKTKGAVQVMTAEKKPVHWFDVLQNGKRAFPGNPPLLNNTVELAPGTYVVDVNHTQKMVTVEAGKKNVLWTGEVVVEGQGANWYYAAQGKERKYVGNPPVLGRATPLFPGAYSVHVHVKMEDKKLGDATVMAGQKTVLKYP